MPASYTDTVRLELVRWLDTVRYKREGWGKFPFHVKTIAPYSLVASGWAIRMLDELNALQAIGEADRQEAAEYLLKAQDPDDGYFKDRFEDVSVYTGFHSWEEVWNSRTSVIHALHALGYSPAIPLPSRRFKDPDQGGYLDWLASLNWANPEKCGEMVSSALIAYSQSLDREQRLDEQEPFFSAFDFLEHEVLDSSTGLPGAGDNPAQKISGLARIQSVYIYFGRPIPLPEKIVDFILDFQDSEGSFGSRGKIPISRYYHALSVLRELNYQLEGGHRVEDIQAAGNMVAHYLLDVYRRTDGGFSSFPDHCQDTNYSIRIGAEHPISDMQACWMAARCMRFTDEWNAGIIFGRRRRPFNY